MTKELEIGIKKKKKKLDNFKKIKKKHSDDFYSSPPFKELNPLLRSYRIAHSYSEDSLQQMGL